MNVEILFPEVANLYGELSNIRFMFGKTNHRLINTHLEDIPAFAESAPDFIYMGAMSENAQELAINRLLPYKNRLKELINQGTFILLTGNAGDVFLNEIVDKENNIKLNGLGIVDGITERRMMKRHNSLYLGNTDMEGIEKKKIVAFKSQFTRTAYSDSYSPLFTTIRGYGRGLKPGSDEGVRINNLMITELLGPLLILNPFFTEGVLGCMVECEPKLPYFDVAVDVYNKRVEEFSQPDRGFTY